MFEQNAKKKDYEKAILGEPEVLLELEVTQLLHEVVPDSPLSPIQHCNVGHVMDVTNIIHFQLILIKSECINN